MRARDFTKNNIAYNRTLNPAAWNDNVLIDEVRDRLLAIAEQFVNYLDISNFTVEDVVLTGSMANYNWTKFSDFDVHVVTNYSDLECDDIAEAFYRAKKQIWNDGHDITIYGYDVELYVEDVAEPPVSEGVYSLLDNRWLKTPDYRVPAIDRASVNAKVLDLKSQIDHAVAAADDPEDIKRITDKIRKMRRAGLDANGEFSTENLAFKILRNMKYMDKLSKAYRQQQDDDLSLK